MAADFLFTSESVTEGHPDKLCDQISDAVLDGILSQDINGRVACEAFVTVGLLIVGGEITTHCYVDIQDLARQVISDIGYHDYRLGFSARGCAILNAIGSQSPDIAQGVDTGGAGDQGLMSGYACRETPELMPMPIMLAHKITQRLAEVRKNKTIPWIGPDGKSQVTVQYIDNKPTRVDTVVVSTQHTEDILSLDGKSITEESRREIINKVIRAVVPDGMLDDNTKYYINPTGKFLIGGPQADTGMTGRKIIVDTYGGMASHGGGAFSGKDPTKVDRSGSYMARYISKNVVASGLADKCNIQIAYAIGVREPVSIMLWADGTNKIEEKRIVELIKKHFNMTPRGIIEQLDLLRPIYRQTAAYGHFGRELDDFTWEKTDLADTLAREA